MTSQKIETGHQDVVHDVAMDYYGKRLATASSDNTVKIIAVNGDSSFPSQPLATLTGHQGPVWQVSWAHPKFGSILASCSYDGRVIIWKETSKPNEWIQIHVFSDHNSSVNSISFSPQEFGLSLACGSSDGSISILAAQSDGSWEGSKIENAHPVGVMSISWAPSSSLGSMIEESSNPEGKLVSGGCDNSIKVWKLKNGSWNIESLLPSLHKDWVRDVAWAPSLGLKKSTIASASQDGTVIVWSLEREGGEWEGKLLNDFKVPVWRVSWSTVGNILAVADGNNDVTLWKEAVDGEWQQVTTIETQ